MCLALVVGKMGFMEFPPTDGDTAVEMLCGEGETLDTLFVDPINVPRSYSTLTSQGLGLSGPRGCGECLDFTLNQGSANYNRWAKLAHHLFL